jgi:type I restriction enzyme, S subunit
MNVHSNGWPVKPLGEVAEFLDNLRVPVKDSERARRQGPYPYYGANGQVGCIDEYIFDEPLVLLAEDGGNFGSKEKSIAYRINGKTWVNNHAHVLRPRQGCDIGFLHRILSFYNVDKVVTGTTRMNM